MARPTLHVASIRVPPCSALPLSLLMPNRTLLLCALMAFTPCTVSAQTPDINPGLQLSSNPPMQVLTDSPPEPQGTHETEFEIRDGYTLVSSISELQDALGRNNQKIRMKPGVYRVESPAAPVQSHQHLFAVTGSDNHFDLRGVVIETPVSVQSRLSRAPHVSDSWHIFGNNNTFEGGYFRNLLDRPYPDYSATENEFEILGDGTTFLDCTFVIQGSIPYGYTDYFGKGGPNFGRLNKHCFLSIAEAKNTTLKRCQVFVQSFGHAIHFHAADGVLIEDCLLSGTLRSTNDIYLEQHGRAIEYDFHAMYRGKRPIPRDEFIPLTEDGIRTYGGDRNITIRNTTIKRFRGCVQVHCDSDITLENVTVLQAGDFAFDVSAGKEGKVTLKNCRADLAFNPIFNLTRGERPFQATYEITVLASQAENPRTPRSGLGSICGNECEFVFRDATGGSDLIQQVELRCGGRLGMNRSTIKNLTGATVVLDDRVRNCRVESIGPVQDMGSGNTIVRLRETTDPES